MTPVRHCIRELSWPRAPAERFGLPAFRVKDPSRRRQSRIVRRGFVRPITNDASSLSRLSQCSVQNTPAVYHGAPTRPAASIASRPKHLRQTQWPHFCECPCPDPCFTVNGYPLRSSLPARLRWLPGGVVQQPTSLTPGTRSSQRKKTTKAKAPEVTAVARRRAAARPARMISSRLR